MTGVSDAGGTPDTADRGIQDSVLIGILMAALMVAGLLWPVEESVAGLGLQWVLLWAVTGVIAALRGLPCPIPGWSQLRALQPAAIADLGCLLLPLGQMMATCGVFIRGGDCRAALNLAFEWGGLWIGWWILRSAMRNQTLRKDLGALLVAMLAGLAVFGIWQHHVIYPEQGQWYLSLRSELDELLEQGGPGGSLRATQIRQELQSNQIPLEGSERELWENRVLSSTEPTGPFALANTFSGLLVAAILLLISSVMERFREIRKDTWLAQAGLAITILILTYTLVLSKSRTAWVGLFVGASWLILWSPVPGIGTRIRRIIIIGGLIAAGSAGLAVASGALDKEVVLEAPKSLQYRLFYWIGTKSVIAEHPLLGTGPGNFRQAYLKYKVPESSEEIRDPHNWILEAWVSGGLASLAGVILILAALICVILRLSVSSSGNENGEARAIEPSLGSTARKGRRRTLSDLTAIGLIAGFLIHAGWSFIVGDSIVGDAFERLWIPAVVWASLWMGCLRQMQWTVRGGCAVLLAMAVHLLGAGGFQMTAPMFIVLMSLAAAVAPDPGASHNTSRLAGIIGLAIVGTFGGCVMVFGLLPVTKGRTLESAGRYFFSRGQISEAQRQFEGAIALDPLSPGMRQRLSEVHAYRLSQVRSQAASKTEGTDYIDTLGRVAVETTDGLIEADLRSTAGYRIKAQCQREMYRITQDFSWLSDSIESYQRVVELYPTSVADIRSLAETARLSDNPEHLELARRSAETVLEMDELNREWGHQDLYLTEEQQKSLREILHPGP